MVTVRLCLVSKQIRTQRTSLAHFTSAGNGSLRPACALRCDLLGASTVKLGRVVRREGRVVQRERRERRERVASLLCDTGVMLTL